MNLVAKTLAAALLALAATFQPAHTQVTRDNFERAHIAIMSASSRASKVAHVGSVPSVTVINLRMRVMRFNLEYDPAALQISAAKNSAGIAKLRSALSHNPATRNALARKGIAISRVVGVEVYSNGALRVYVL